MKKDIHPDYQECTVKCVCGNEFTTRSTLKEINVEICAACHPFFTGQQKLVDSAGRVDRFLKKYGDDYARGAAASAGRDGEARAAAEATETEAPDDAPAADAAPPAGGEDKAEAEN
jgi:large subunit ribosomal protein L31